MQKLTSLFFVLLCFTATTSSVLGQSGGAGGSTPAVPEIISKIIPPSPTAASLGKYGDIPVSMYTGTPNIDIPLYTLKCGELSVPISASYHASGVKVSETASWVGLGWSLNAGGVITRTMLGRPDESSGGFLNLPFDPETLANDETYTATQQCSYTSQLLSGALDGQADVFNFNFGGYTGKFVFAVNGGIHLIPQQNLKIEKTLGTSGIINFTITTPDGTKYLFAEVEVTESSNQFSSSPIFNSSWYLTSITTANQVDVVTFLYATENISTMNDSYSSTTPYQSNTAVCNEGGTTFAHSVSQNQIASKRLTTIQSACGQILFDAELRTDLLGAGKLTQIRIGNAGGTIVKKFDFNTTYFTTLNPTMHLDYRLKLTSIQERDKDNNPLPPYAFQYNETYKLPRVHSLAQDHWGFYNGQDANDQDAFGIPAITYNNVSYPGINKEPNATYGKTAILTQITYPTGGNTVFDYEGHQYSAVEPQYVAPPTNGSNEAWLTTDGNPYNDKPETTFTIGGTVAVPVTFNLYYAPTYESQGFGSTPTAVLLKGGANLVQISNIVANNSFAEALSFNIASSTTYDLSNFPPIVSQSYQYTLQPGTYKLSTWVYQNIPDVWVRANVTWAATGAGYLGMQVVTNPAGGIRIKEIISNAGNGSAPLTKRYTYFTDDHQGNNTNVSSGVLFQKYQYYQSYSTIIIEGSYAEVPCNYLARYANNILPSSLTQGSHIGYSQVLEQQVLGSDTNGSSRYYYATNANQGAYNHQSLAVNTATPVSNLDYKRGHLLRKKVYSSTQKLLQKQEFVYKENYDTDFEVVNVVPYKNPEIASFIVCEFHNPQSLKPYYLYDTYVHRSAWRYLEQEINTTYDQNGQNPITSTTTYAYNNPTHKLPTSIIQTGSGDSYETRTKYPADYPTASDLSSDPYIAAIGKMKTTMHMHNYPIEVLQLKNGKIIGGSVSKYKTFGTHDIEIHEQYNLETAEALTVGAYTPVTINGSSFTLDSRLKLAYTLNYNATGDISSFVRPKAGKQYNFIWSGNTHLLLSQTIQNISSTPNTPANQTTTYTYDALFKQLSTITDPNGKVTTYTYDVFGRLKSSTYDGQTEKEIGYHYGSQANETWNTTLLGGVTPTANQNYICTRDKGVLRNITYIDGLGRPIQNIAIGQGGTTTSVEASITTLGDIVEPITYDDFGRQANKYLPYTRQVASGNNIESAVFDANAIANQLVFYNSTSGVTQITDGNTFAQTVFEASPLNRPTEQGFAGATWVIGDDSTIKTQYLTTNGYLLTRTTDEKGNISKTYTNARGRVVLQQSVMNTEADLSDDVFTAYMYNNMDRLETVSSAAGTYAYEYDERGRLIAKVIPGKGVEYFVYDPLDRLVLQQDAKMRLTNKWLYTKYDAFDRPIETGLYTNTTQSRSDLQTIFNQKTTYDAPTTGFANLPNNNTEQLTTTLYDPVGFKGQVASFTEKILFPGNNDLTSYNNILAQGGSSSGITTNQITTTYAYDNQYRVTEKRQSNHLGGTTTNNLTNYTYNNFDQVLTQNQAHATSPAGATATNLSLTKNLYYDAANRLRQVWNNGTITAHHNYNPIGQLTEKKLHRLGASGSIFLQSVDYQYNPRGWLTQINQPVLNSSGDINGDAFAQSLSYQPNGNIAGIQIKSAYPDGSNAYNVTNLDADYTYDNLNRLLTTNTQLTAPNTGNYSETFTYNPAGNITNLQRYGKLTTTTTGIIDQLTYTYPNQSNQVKAVQDAVNTPTTEANDFEEANELATEYFYDANGNMIIDGNKQLLVAYNHLNLPTTVFYPQDGRFILWLYTATGTKLQKYVCSTTPKTIFDQAQNYAINNASLQSPHIQYAKRFANISTQRNAATQNLNPTELYQHLQDTISLVRSQAIPNTNTGTYQEPQSLIDLVGIPQTQATVTCYKHDYIGNIEYQNNQLEAYYTEEGRINYAQNTRHEYNLKDHLGNTRLCFTPNPANPTSTLPKILQQTNYYAYGLPIAHLSRTYPLSGTMALEEKYQYNNKELNNDFGLLWSDYGARWLDLQRGVWQQIDPLAEKYYAWSGYNYVLGNPIKIVDLDGMEGTLFVQIMSGNQDIVSIIGQLTNYINTTYQDQENVAVSAQFFVSDKVGLPEGFNEKHDSYVVMGSGQQLINFQKKADAGTWGWEHIGRVEEGSVGSIIGESAVNKPFSVINTDNLNKWKEDKFKSFTQFVGNVIMHERGHPLFNGHPWARSYTRDGGDYTKVSFGGHVPNTIMDDPPLSNYHDSIMRNRLIERHGAYDPIEESKHRYFERHAIQW